MASMIPNYGVIGMQGSPGSIGIQGTPITTMGSAGIQKTTYHILGEDIEIDAPQDFNTTIAISTLNVLGKPFYDELKKNGVNFNEKIEEYLKVKFRDIKIETILNDQNND